LLAQAPGDLDFRLQDLISVEYIIIGGVAPDQGAVLTREREDASDVWRIQVSLLVFGAD